MLSTQKVPWGVRDGGEAGKMGERGGLGEVLKGNGAWWDGEQWQGKVWSGDEGLWRVEGWLGVGFRQGVVS